MLDLEKRAEQFELQLVQGELDTFHASCDVADESAIMEELELLTEDTDDECAYFFGRMENAEIVNSAYQPELDEQLF